jgi:hypothetical protein
MLSGLRIEELQIGDGALAVRGARVTVRNTIAGALVGGGRNARRWSAEAPGWLASGVPGPRRSPA